jgi:hypothetical protein
MDLLELRILAVSGILAIGVTISALAVALVATTERLRRLRQGRAAAATGARAVGKAAGLGVGQARC